MGKKEVIDPAKYIKTLTGGQIPAGSARPGRQYLSKGGKTIVVYYAGQAPGKCGRRPATGGIPYKQLGQWPSYGWLAPDYPLTEIKQEEENSHVECS